MSKKSSRIIHLEAPAIMCSGCAQSIKKILNDSEISFRKIYVNWPAKIISVVLDDDVKQTDKEITEIIKKNLDNAFPSRSRQSIKSYVIKGIVGTVTGLALVVIMACGLTMPLIAMYLIGYISTVLTLYLGFDTYLAAVMQFIKTRTLTMDALFTVSTITAIGVSIAAFFVPWLPMMFDVALLIFGFKHIGTAIEETANRKVMRGIAFRDRIPETIKLDGREEVIPVNDLKIGDVIIVGKGAIIPVDGECLEEESYVYETIYNGNSVPQKINKGRLLLGGMRVGENVEYMKIKVTATEENSYPTVIDKRIDDAMVATSPAENTTDKILRYFVPVVFGIAILSGIIIGCLFPPAIAIQCVIATLVSACPCTLGFITPLAMNIGIGKARDNGVEIKGGEALQSAAEIDTVVFDLNGTLTTGIKTVSNIELLDEKIPTEKVQDYLYHLEQNAKDKHPVAKAIYQYAKSAESRSKDYQVEHTDEQNNSGVRCKINNEWFTLGNSTMMKEYRIDISQYESNVNRTLGNQIIYLARDKQLISVINITDPLRPDAKALIQALQQSEKKIYIEDMYICTGSDFKTAKTYADQLGIPEKNIRANCIPAKKDAAIDKQTKIAFIESLKKEGRKPALIGDGGNDALAMNACFGIAIKSETSDEVTEDNAKAVIAERSLMPIATTFSVAKQTIKNIKVSLGISLAYNMTVLLLAGGLLAAVGFALNPAVGVALMIVQACFILAAAYHFKQKQLPKPKQLQSGPSPQHDPSSTNALLKIFRPTPSKQAVQKKEYIQKQHAPLKKISKWFSSFFGQKKPSQIAKTPKISLNSPKFT